MADHATKIADEGKFVRADQDGAVEKARALHHLATADPEPQRDGQLTGPQHELKYGLERADGSVQSWVAAGVHPVENRAIVDGENVDVNGSGAAVSKPTAAKPAQ